MRSIRIRAGSTWRQTPKFPKVDGGAQIQRHRGDTDLCRPIHFAVPHDEHCEAKRACHSGDTELFSQVPDAWRVYRGADINAEGEQADVECDEAFFEGRPLS